MPDADERPSDLTPAMWPAQHLVERIVGGIYEQAVDAVAALRTWSRQEALERELTTLADDDLADLGITRDQIPALARSQEAPELLQRMLKRLGAPEQLLAKYPSLHSRLGHECALCFSRAACKRWLRDGGPVDGYKHFCPNAAILGKLIESAAAPATATEPSLVRSAPSAAAPRPD